MGRVVEKNIEVSGAMVRLYVVCEAHNDENGNAIQPPQHASGWLVLMKKDGSPSVKQIDNIKQALGWDGKTFSGLQALDVSGVDVNFTVQANTNEATGKTYYNVAWVNPIGAAPSKVVPPDRKALAAADAALQRAMSQQPKPLAKALAPAAKLRGFPHDELAEINEADIPY